MTDKKEKMNIPEEQVKIMKILEGVSSRLGMKARWIATNLYGPPSHYRKKLRNGHEINRSIGKLRENGFIEDIKDSKPNNPASWVLTDKGKESLRRSVREEEVK